MPSIGRFETKRGECRFEDGALALDESIRGYLRNLYEGYWHSDAWWRKAVFVAYVLVVPVSLFNFVVNWNEVDSWVPIVLGALVAVAVVLYAVQRFVRGFTSRDRIPLDAVTSISLAMGSKGLTRPRFVVTFDDGGERRKRHVLLPSLYLPHGEETMERAVEAFEERGFDVDRS